MFPWTSNKHVAHLEATIRALEDTIARAREATQRDQVRDGLISTLQDTLRQKAALDAAYGASREQLAALRSSFEWLTTHVNQLQEERSQLLARVIGVSFPSMEIGVSPVMAQTPAGAAESRIHGVPLADSYENSVPGTQVATSMFEDPGDDLASQLGVKHDAVGNVQYAR